MEEGETAMLVCALRPDVSKPHALVFQSWSKASGGGRFERNMRPNIERLQILKFRRTNEGAYRCQVVTSEGFRNEVLVTLRLKDGASVQPNAAESGAGAAAALAAKIREGGREVRAGEDFEITCDVTGSPRPQVVWMLNQER